MQIKIRLFAVLKEVVGKESLDLELSPDASCAQAISILEREYEDLGPILKRSLVAINGVYANRQDALSERDELAILAPVSGG